MDWIHLAQDIEMFLRYCERDNRNSSTIKGGEFLWLAEKLFAFHERLCFVELVIGDELQSLTLKFNSCIEYCDIPCVYLTLPCVSMSETNFRA